jgi:hypothetical protein
MKPCKRIAGKEVWRLINRPFEPDGNVNKSPGDNNTKREKAKTDLNA